MEHWKVIESLKRDNPFNPSKATNIYQYGSHVYGTVGPQSDFDVIAVSDIEESHIQFHWKDFNCTVFSTEEFETRLAEHDMTMLECIFLPDKFIISNCKDYRKTFELDKYQLRRAVSKKASNSFVKAKKKLIVKESFDPYVAKKSLFHSLRIPIFGMQIAEYNRIIDYQAANQFWPQIRDCGHNDWGYYQKKFKPVFNKIMTEFRKRAPKG